MQKEKGLFVVVPVKEHRMIKSEAASQGKTMQQLMIDIVEYYFNHVCKEEEIK